MVEQWLRSRADDARRGPVRPELVRAWQVAQAAEGRCRVEDLAARGPAEPAPAADADGRRDRAVAEAAAATVPFRRGDRATWPTATARSRRSRPRRAMPTRPT